MRPLVSKQKTWCFAAVIMATRAMLPRPAPKFLADRPFFFALVNLTPMTGLFAGRLSKP